MHWDWYWAYAITAAMHVAACIVRTYATAHADTVCMSSCSCLQAHRIRWLVGDGLAWGHIVFASCGRTYLRQVHYTNHVNSSAVVAQAVQHWLVCLLVLSYKYVPGGLCLPLCHEGEFRFFLFIEAHDLVRHGELVSEGHVAGAEKALVGLAREARLIHLRLDSSCEDMRAVIVGSKGIDLSESCLESSGSCLGAVWEMFGVGWKLLGDCAGALWALYLRLL